MSILYFICIITQNWNMSQGARKILANNIERLRKSKNMTKEALSLVLGFENSYISKVERLKMNITIDKLSLIADYLGVEIKDLFIK